MSSQHTGPRRPATSIAESEALIRADKEREGWWANFVGMLGALALIVLIPVLIWLVGYSFIGLICAFARCS